LRADLRFLIHLWDEIKQRSDSSKSPALIYHDLSLIERILRDQVSANFSSIWVDSQDDYERIVRFLNRFSPTLVRRVKLYTKEVPLFEHFGIQDEISKALRSKVWLKSGGSIVINQTEALVAIDINTGKYVGKSARLEDTIVKTNLDAVPEIVRQIRLRDLGGIIVIDFIDMDERKNRFKVMAALEEALKSDRAPTKVLQFNDFGLVAITRKRVKQSLERTLSVPCPTCQATGMVKSPTTVCNEIYTELRKMKKHFEGADVLLRVNPETVKVLKQTTPRGSPNSRSWSARTSWSRATPRCIRSSSTFRAKCRAGSLLASTRAIHAPSLPEAYPLHIPDGAESETKGATIEGRMRSSRRRVSILRQVEFASANSRPFRYCHGRPIRHECRIGSTHEHLSKLCSVKSCCVS
jgi:hypothetical protein